ncbi:SDR family NAD(P)-dependent oxidoreductase [Chroococcidiopsis thermalis]|uniref:Short-chain dehydrogenase/reductase SDR n=1 Tax=Chroococcidiopsis thermalis (strain PCC 7203) TaxID=251229 RepID=K9U6C2_CHRTP|nr:SDR family NAD(P)-dependent oxidoreductase [Chroococcidiopsis thermalis]AFY90662.1 short-chain dehydrogenase/reductase SDR [Chroococcidiopsis thermalis PCC 7203]
MIRLDDRVAIITGSGRGLGAAYARLLAERGARVVVHDAGVNKEGTGSDPTVVADVANNIREKGGVAIASDVLLNSRDNCRSLVEMTLEKFDRLDILIHNAGWVAYQSIQDLSPDFLERAININIEAPTWLSQAALPRMKQQHYGRIVLTTSDRAIYQQYALGGLAAYAMGKMAQIGLMNVLAVEGKEQGILVNAISPVAKTRMWNVQDEPEDLRPEQVAPGVLYLASPECQESGFILRASNGQFTAMRPIERSNVNYPFNLAAVESSTAEDLSTRWQEIAADVAF